MVAVEGPLVCDQALDTIVPPPDSDPMPLNVTLFTGSVIVWSDPAFATGDPGLATAGFTVIFTASVAFTPSASVTVSSKEYTPCTKPVTPVDALDALVMEAV